MLHGIRDVRVRLEQANQLREEGKLREAAAELERAAEIARGDEGLKRLLLVDILTRLSALYIKIGSSKQADEVLMEARAILGESSGPPDSRVLTTLNNQAANDLQRGEYAAARTKLLEVAEIHRGTQPSDRLELARALSNLSVACTQLGLREEAQAHCREAHDLLKPRVEADDPLMAVVLHNWGFSHKGAGRWGAALYCFDQARRSLEKGSADLSLDLATVLLEMAELLQWMLQPDQGFVLAYRSMEIRSAVLGNTDPSVAQAAQSAGRLLLNTGDFTRAVSYLKPAFQIYLAVLGIQDPRTLGAWHDLVRGSWRTGEQENVILDLQDRLPIYRSVAASENPYLFYALVDLAGALEVHGKLDEARQRTLEAAEMARDLQALCNERLGGYCEELAALLERQGEGRLGIPLLQRAFRANDRLVDQALTTRDDLQRRRYLRRLAAEAGRFVQLVAEQAPRDPAAVAGAFHFVANRKGLRAEASMARDDVRLRREQPELEPLLKQVHDLEQELLEVQGGGFPDGVRGTLQRQDELRRKLRDLNGEVEARTLLESRPRLLLRANASVEEIAAALPPGSALVEYYAMVSTKQDPVRAEIEKTGDEDWLLPEQRAERYVAFVLRAGEGEPVQFFDLGDAGELETLAYSYLVTMSGGRFTLVPRDRQKDVREFREEELSVLLRRKLFDPVADAVRECRTVLVAPDGAVCRVPFGALLEDGDGDRRLLDRYVFGYLTTGRSVLGFGRDVAEPGEPPVVLGDPDYDFAKPGSASEVPAVADFYFARLKGTADEAWRVSQRIGGRVLSKKKATEQALRECRSPAILHLATHGYYIPPFSQGALVIGDWRRGSSSGYIRREVLGFSSNPFLRSGIVLAGVNAWSAGRPLPAGVGDGLLNSAEVAHLDLRGTELVVLSACSSALGDVVPADGVAGLLHGFHLAGARAIVASLWQIPDEATGQLMETFYDGLTRGMSRLEALREAQLGLRRAQKPAWQWASYVCYGEPSPMQYRPRLSG